MKWQAAVILLAIALSIVVPPSLPLAISQGNQVEIGTADVCHSASPALSSNGDMPCLSQSPCHLLPLLQNTVVETASQHFKPSITAFQDERPPKA